MWEQPLGKMMRARWEQLLGKVLDHQCQNRAMTHVFRNIKSSWQHPRFIILFARYIDILNKQFVSPLSGNNPLSETSLDESYILTIYRHLDAKEIYHWGVE